jgi:hypothetical protein
MALEPVACQPRYFVRRIGNKTAGVTLNLMLQRDKVAVELKTMESRLNANASLFAAGRDLWERCLHCAGVQSATVTVVG